MATSSDYLVRFRSECALFEMALKNHTPLSDDERQALRFKLHELLFWLATPTPILTASDQPPKNLSD